MSTYNEGDLIEAVKGDTVIRGRLAKSELRTSLRLVGTGWGIDSLTSQDFTLTVIERAKPKLPTELGVYTVHPLAADPLLYQLTPFGWRVLWHEGASEMRDEAAMLSGIGDPATLVKLTPAVSA